MDLIPGLPYDIGLQCLVRIPYQYFPCVASVCKDWKRQIHLPEFWRIRTESGSTRRVVVMAMSRVDPTLEDVESKKPSAVAVGGSPVYRLVVCEPDSGFWSDLPPLPGRSGGLPLFCRVVGVGSDLVVMGGCDPVTWEVSNEVYIYNFVSAEWRRGADMPGCRRLFFACAAPSDGSRTVFVAGGHDEDKCALRSAMAYDVTRDEWLAIPDMARERDEAAAVFHGGEFLVVGGYLTEAQGRFESSAEAFDPESWRWRPVEEDFLETPGCPKNCTVGGDGNLYTCRDVDLLVREGSAWRRAAEIPPEVRNTAYVAAWSGKVMVVGSERFGAPYVEFVLNLESGKWQRVALAEEFSGHVQAGCCLEL